MFDSNQYTKNLDRFFPMTFDSYACLLTTYAGHIYASGAPKAASAYL